MPLLHTADLHLTSRGHDERWDALEHLLAVATDRNADALVISGDLFDANSDVSLLKPELRRRLEDTSVPVVIIPGNHDVGGLGSGDYLGRTSALLLEAGAFVDVGDFRIIGLPFEDVGESAVIDRLYTAAQSIRDGGTNVLLYHGELMDLVPTRDDHGEEGAHEYMPVSLATLEGFDFDFVLAGHFHRSFDVRRSGNGYVVYPGSPVSITRKETGVRSAAWIEAGKAPTPVALATKHFQRIGVTLSPFEPGDPIEQIKYELTRVPEHATVELTVGGFIDLAARGETEAGFARSLDELRAWPGVATLAAEWSDVGELIKNDMYQRFLARLERKRIPEDERRRVAKLVLSAMMETAHAD